MRYQRRSGRRAAAALLAGAMAVAAVVTAGLVAAEPGNGGGKGGGTGGGGGGNGGGKPTTTTTSSTTSSTSSTTTTTQPAEAVDLAVALVDSADPAPLGEVLTYTVTVSNVGSTAVDGATTNIIVRHADVRGTFLFEDVTTTSGTCNEPVVSDVQLFGLVEEGDYVACTFDRIEAGGEVTVTVSGRATWATRSAGRAAPALSARAYVHPPGGVTESDHTNNSTFEHTDVTTGDDSHDCLMWRAWVWTGNPAYPAECVVTP